MLMRANKDGTGITTLSQDHSFGPVAVSGSTLVFFDGAVGTGGMRSCTVDDCSNPTPIMPDVITINFDALLVDASGVYVNSNGSTYFSALNDTADTELGQGASHVSTNMVAVAATLVWGDVAAQTIEALPKAGGSKSTLLTGIGVPNRIAADDTAFYVTTQDGRIIKLVM
jgi:hypothetical protein